MQITINKRDMLLETTFNNISGEFRNMLNNINEIKSLLSKVKNDLVLLAYKLYIFFLVFRKFSLKGKRPNNYLFLFFAIKYFKELRHLMKTLLSSISLINFEII
jgi:restriction endonuclease S subunit